MRAYSLFAYASALVGVAGCSAEVIPATGRVFLYPRPAAEGELTFVQSAPTSAAASKPGAYTSATLSLAGLDAASVSTAAPLEQIEWSVEGGRHGNTKEQVATVALYVGSRVVTAKKVRFIVPWSGAKRLEVTVPKECAARVPGSSECDLEKLPEEWFDVTTLEDYRAP
jgi:hypothetical protein